MAEQKAGFRAVAAQAVTKKNATATEKGPSVSVTGEVTDTEIIVRIPRQFLESDMRLTLPKPNKVQLPFVAFKADLGDTVPITVLGTDGNKTEIYTRRNITANLFCSWTPAASADDGSEQ